MKKKDMIKVLVAIMVLVLTFVTFSSCSSETESDSPNHVGTLTVKVNPEFGVNYDLDGNVTSIDARNANAETLLKDYTGYEGKASREVVKELVALMNDAGYFDTEVDGEGKTITIQVDPESQIPDVNFLTDVVGDIKGYFDDKQVTGKIAIEGESNYGMSEYAVSDYGETNFKTVKTTVKSDAARYTDYANTDYDGYNTDYGANTDYDGKNTDYEDRIGSNTDYDGYNSDYGANTDYDDTNTDYASNYGYSSGSSSSGSSSSSSGSSSSSSGSSSSSSGSSGSSSSSSSSSGGSNTDYNTPYDSNTNYNSPYDANTNYDSDSDYDD